MLPLSPRHRARVCAPALSCLVSLVSYYWIGNLFLPSPFRWSTGPSWPSPLPAPGVGCREVVDKRRGWVWCFSRRPPSCPCSAVMFLTFFWKGWAKGSHCAVTLPTLSNTNSFISKRLGRWNVFFFKRDNFFFLSIIITTFSVNHAAGKTQS